MLLPQEYNALSDHVYWRPAARTAAHVRPSKGMANDTAGSRSAGAIGVRPPTWDEGRDVPFTRGGAPVKILHYAVEDKPWNESLCQRMGSP